MNTKYFFSLFFLSGLSLAAPRIDLAPVKHIYVPMGFDSNDSVEVVVTGYFPNPCFSRNTVKVDVAGDKIQVSITALESKAKLACPDMTVPFKEVVSLGNLQGGTYQVTVNSQLRDQLVISEADSNAVDDHIYAAIDEVVKTAENEYVLKGWRYSHCIELDRVEMISNGKDTISVLPIMKQVSDFCPMKLTPVEYAVKLDLQSLKIKEKLIHVRTMDGKSFNKILDL